jgi:hypothetical protein
MILFASDRVIESINTFLIAATERNFYDLAIAMRKDLSGLATKLKPSSLMFQSAVYRVTSSLSSHCSFALNLQDCSGTYAKDDLRIKPYKLYTAPDCSIVPLGIHAV